MANGYLGKISAIVSANTADFDNKLNKSAAEVRKFAASMQGSLASAQSGSAASLRGIYTDAQKLERALKAVATQKLSFKGFQDANLDAAVARMKALYSASSQINKPLSDAAKSFSKLSLAAQAEFIPALTSAQAMVEKLADVIETTGTASEGQFARVARSVEVVTTAMGRMKEASSLVSGLATGQELRFQRPEMVSEMQRSAALQSQAAQMSPAAINQNGIAGLVSQQRAAAVETERLAAALERESQLVNGNVAGATAAYQSQLAVQSKINDEIERRVGAEAAAGAKAAAAANAEIAILQRRQQAAKAAEAERQAQAQKASDAEIAILQRTQQAAKAAELERQAQSQRTADAEIAVLQRLQQASKASELERQAQSQRTADAEIALLQRVQQAGKAAELERQAQAQRAADAELALIQRRQQAAKAAELESQAQAQRTADAELTILQRREQAAKAAELERQARAAAAADAEIALLIRREQAARAAEGGGVTSLGFDIEDPRRQLGVLEGSITSLKSRIDTLPEPLRARFVPAIRDAEREFIRLSTAVVPVAAEIEAARRRLVVLTQDATRAAAAMNFAGSFGGEGITGINLGLDQRALRGFEGALTSLQGALGRTRAAARGPAVAAFNELRNAIAQAFAAGTTEEPATRQRIARLQAAAVNATSQAGGGSVNRIRRDMQRAGDVGRGGFDNLSLAANQAAFAIDDFLSSTGGLDQKLRAVSNNITQMAFVLGGTTGLFVGLGAVLAGQLAVGLVRYINNGRTSEDQTKALNDALSRQKGLVEELAQAFRSLGDAMSRGTFSAAADAGRQFGQGVSDIRRKQRDAREALVAGSNVAFQQNAANLSRDKRQLETEDNPGIRAVLANRIREAESINRGLPSVLANRAPQLTAVSGTRGMGTGEINTPERLQEVLVQEALRNIPTMQNTPTGRGIILEEERERRARVMAGSAGDTISSQREAIQTMIGQLAPQAGEYTPGGREASQTIARLQSLLDQLETPFQRAIDEMALKVAAASEEAARSIRSSQEDVAAAISRGVPGAALFQQRLDSLASELADADAQLARSVEMAAETGDPSKREAVVKAAEEKVAAVRIKQAETEARAREMRLGRSMGGERLTQATASMEGNERFRNERAGLIAQGRASADAELVAARKVEQSAASVGDRQQQLRDARAERQKIEDAGGDTTAADASVAKAEADLKAAQAAAEAAGQNLELARRSSEAAAALAEAAIAIEAAIARIRKIGESALQKSEAGADAAQKEFESNPLRGGAAGARDAAEARLIDDRARVANAQADLDNKRREIQADPRMVGIDNEIEVNKQRRQDLEAKAALGGITPKEQGELDTATKREIELMRQREQLAQNLTEAERKQLDAINNGIAAREKELEKSRQRSEDSAEFNRTKSQADATLGEANRRADEAQQRFASNPTDENKQRRDDAESQLRRRQGRLQEFQDLADKQRKFTEASPEFQENSKELQKIAERRAQIASDSAGRGLTQLEDRELGGENGLIQRERELRANNEALMQKSMEPYRDTIDKAQRDDALRARADRGRDLGMTKRDRFAKEFGEGAGADINARAAELRQRGEDPTKFLQQAFQNEVEKSAPMFQQFAEERENARLQGPSRAALQMTDVSTSQGASELNRLLRGDDSAKDVNLAELRKQNDNLQTIADLLREANPGVLL
jgi:hypothetical protein